jgi:Organic radical activating enzymes
MPITLIVQKPNFTKTVEGVNKLSISEMFVDTLQGEGITTGHPATFIRLQGCTLSCQWCDTLDVWPHGNEYSFEEVIEMLLPFKEKYRRGGQHIILTGGSPLKQQDALHRFLHDLTNAFGFKPFIECENEAVLMPGPLLMWVDVWNNSPKLSNSGMKERARIHPEVLQFMSNLPNSWFKFVVNGTSDWVEIEKDFLRHIKKSQIILMPEGQTQEELARHREEVAWLALEVGVKYCDRLHIIIWNQKTGV